MSSTAADERRNFSWEQANAMLPLLRLIVADISLAHRELSARRSDLARLQRRKETAAGWGHFAEEVAETRKDLQQERQQLEAMIDELERLGVVLRSAHDGIVNFPTLIDEQPAFFSWQMNDPQVLYWHRTDEPTSQRRVFRPSRVISAGG